LVAEISKRGNVVRVKRLFKHFFVQPRSVLVFVLFVALHWLLRYHTFLNNTQLVDKFSSAVFQIIGMGLVLFAIDSNLGIISGSNVYQKVIGWFKRTPGLFREDIKLNVADSKVGCRAGSPEISVDSRPETIEDKVTRLFEEVERLDEKITSSEKRLQGKISEVDKSANEKFRSIIKRFNELDIKLQKSTVGGAEIEILGALFIIYGIFIPLVFS